MSGTVSTPHIQKLVGCKHGNRNIQDAKQLPCNLEIAHGQSQYCNQHKSYNTIIIIIIMTTDLGNENKIMITDVATDNNKMHL